MKYNSHTRSLAITLMIAVCAVTMISCAKNAESNIGTYETDVYIPVETTPVPEYDKYDELMTAFSDNGVTPPESFEYTDNGEYVTIDGLKCTDIVIVIPEAVNGKPVKAVSDGAFGKNTFIKAICFPETVEKIGDGVLTGCNSVTTLKMPLSAVTDGAFGRIFGADGYQTNAVYTPASLTTVIFTGDETEVPEYCFFGCGHIKNVILPENVTDIGKFAFFNCAELKYIYLPESLRTVGEYVFSHCSSLQTIKLPPNVVSVGLGAYEDCPSVLTLEAPIFGGGDQHPWLGYIFGAEEYTWNRGYVPASLQSVKITGENTEVPLNAFYDCPYIVTVTLPDSIVSISIRAFYGCRGLTGFEFPENCREVGDEAFYKCVGLTGIASESLKIVGMQAFYGCISLESADLGNAEEIGSSAFCGCTSLSKFNAGKASVGTDALKNTKVN